MPSREIIQSRVEGLDRARRALERVIRAEQAAIPGALAAIGQQAVTETRRRAPLRTGRLRRSYTYEVDGQGRWVDVGSNVEYAPYQEFGTVRIEGTPHLRPGIEATTRQIGKLVVSPVAAAGAAAARRAGGRVSLANAASALANLTP